MREKVSTAYFLDDPRKFSSMEEAEKELNRLRAVCVRLKKKQGEDIAFMLGLSVTDSQYMGKMGYQKSMRYGGKKVFICSERRIHNGERVEPCTDKPPHIHIMVQGYGASTAAEDEKDLSKVNFDIELYKVYTEGYLSAAGKSLTDAEVEYLPFSSKLMTLECGMRFLGDYLNGDTYFRIDYPEHNLVRARTQFKLVEDMEKQTDEMKKVTQEIYEKVCK